MISDRMDESLILMKNELDLSLEDILYFTMNRRLETLTANLP